MENKRKQHKIYVITKFIEGKISGLLKTNQMQRIRLTNHIKTPETMLDNLFYDYLDNFCPNEEDRQYWLSRYMN